jgi:hypothetical protein
MGNRITVETCYKIWDDESGDRFEVCDDADGLEMTEIRYVDSDGKICSRIAIADKFLPAIFKAIERKMIERELPLA